MGCHWAPRGQPRSPCLRAHPHTLSSLLPLSLLNAMSLSSTSQNPPLLRREMAVKRQPFSEADPGVMNSRFSMQSPLSTPPPCDSADIPLGRFCDSAHPQQQASPRHHQTARCPNLTDASGRSDKLLGQLHTTPRRPFLKNSMSSRLHNNGVRETAGIAFTFSCFTQ